MRVVNFTFQPNSLPPPPGENPRYKMDRRLGGPHKWSGQRGEEINPCPYPDSNSYPSDVLPDRILWSNDIRLVRSDQDCLLLNRNTLIVLPFWGMICFRDTMTILYCGFLNCNTLYSGKYLPATGTLCFQGRREDWGSILSRVRVTKTRVWAGNGFIESSLVVTSNNFQDYCNYNIQSLQFTH
jgi:hypothetical protein